MNIYPDYVRCNADKADLNRFEMKHHERAGSDVHVTYVNVWARTVDEADEVFTKWEQSERKPEPEPTPDLFES